MKKIIVFITVLMIFPTGFSKAQSTNAITVNQVAAFPIKIQLIKESPDQKGTDTENIYMIEIDYDRKLDATNNPYTIIYFLDDRFEAEFKNQPLPFSFKRDLKGQTQGDHVIRIEIEDEKETPLAKAEIVLKTNPARLEKTNKRPETIELK